MTFFQDFAGVLGVTAEEEEVMAAKRFIAPSRSHLWGKGETLILMLRGQRTKMESEGVGVGMDLLQGKVSSVSI